MAEETLTRTDSAGPTEKKRVRDESDGAVLDSPEVKRLRDDLFDVFDDSDPEPVSQDLDSVMKSFEDELSSAQPRGETQPDLGYLFEASDDELGLPPPQPSTLLPPSSGETKETELVRASSDSSGVGELRGIEEPVPGFGSFELDDGLFEYSDVSLDSGDLFSWRPETLPAE